MSYLGSQFICSNISPYVQSYFKCDIADTQLMLPVISTVSMPAIILGSFLTKNRMNPRLQILIGGSVGITGCLLSSMVTQYHWFLVLFTVPWGFANGFTYVVPLHLAWAYFPNREGLIAGLIVGSFGLGGFIFGLVSTSLANPDEVDSNVVDDRDREHAVMPFDDDVAKNVPHMLRQLALIWTCIMLITMCLIQEEPKKVSTAEAGILDPLES